MLVVRPLFIYSKLNTDNICRLGTSVLRLITTVALAVCYDEYLLKNAKLASLLLASTPLL